MTTKTPQSKHILCVAGKSGGHIIPCLTIAQRSLLLNGTISIITTNGALDTHIVQQYQALQHTYTLSIMNVPYKTWWKFPLFLGQVCFSFIKSILILSKRRPDVIITTGGYLAIPVCYAAFLLRIPIDVYELNVIPGKATQALVWCTRTLFVCFSKTAIYFKKKTCLTHYPIRFTQQTNIENNQPPLENYSSSKKTILVLGGSQGSQFINQQLCTLASLYGPSLQIIHQTGADHVAMLQHFYSQLGVCHKVFSYEQNLAPYYHIADLVLCRSGAGTLFETLYFKKKCITIPLETHTTNHQYENAQTLAHYYPEYFSLIRQQELQHDPLKLFNMVSHFLG